MGRLTVEVVGRLLADHPEHEYVVLRHPSAPRIPVPSDARLEEHVVACPVASPQQALAFARLPKRLGIDVLLHTHPLAAPLWTGCPSVGMVLDVYPLLFPRDYPRRVALYYRAVVPFAERTKRKVIAISHASRLDVIRYLGLAPERVEVVPLAPAPVFRRETDRAALRARLAARDLSAPFVVYTGNRRPHKNVVRLLEAHAGLRSLRQEIPQLVITGREDPNERADDTDHLRQLVHSLSMDEHVRFIGEVDDETLADLYNAAEVVAIPSLYEGFGLPAIEAMACGAPVLAGRAGALPEVVGDAGLLVDPYDTDEIAGGLARLLDDDLLRRRLMEAAHKRASQFSWGYTADQILRICLQAAA